MRRHLTLRSLLQREERRGSDHVKGILGSLGPIVPMGEMLRLLGQCGCQFCRIAIEQIERQFSRAIRSFPFAEEASSQVADKEAN